MGTPYLRIGGLLESGPNISKTADYNSGNLESLTNNKPQIYAQNPGISILHIPGDERQIDTSMVPGY